MPAHKKYTVLVAAAETLLKAKLSSDIAVYLRRTGALSRKAVRGMVLCTLGSGERNRSQTELGVPTNDIVIICAIAGAGKNEVQQDLNAEDILDEVEDAFDDHGDPPLGDANVDEVFMSGFTKVDVGRIDARITVRKWTT